MRNVRLIAANDARMLLVDAFAMVVLIFMPIVTLAFLANAIEGGAAQAVPGFMALFGFFGLSIVGSNFYREHGWRTWQRFLASSAKPWEVVVGKATPLAVLFVVQQLVVLGFGWLLFDMPFRGSVVAGGLVVLAIASVEVALGLVLVTVCKTMSQVTTIGNLGAVLLAGMGGGLAPVSALPQWADNVAPASPIYWGLKGLRTVIRDGGGVADVVEPILVLTAIAGAAFAIAAVRYRSDEPKQFFL